MQSNPEQNFQDFFFEVCLNQKSKLAEVPIENISNGLVIQNGKLEGGIALGVVGGIVGFALGGVPAILTGITMGFALGYSLFPEKEKKKKPKAPSFSFEGLSGEGIATQGSAIPIIYTSFSKNPLGGVRTNGKLVACKVENRGDCGELYSIIALSLGEIQEIDDSKLLIDGQTIERYYEDDIVIHSLVGTPTFYNNQGQETFPTDYNFFGQCVSPNSYNLLGTSKRAQAKNTTIQPTTRTISTSWGVVNCYISSSSGSSRIFTKNAGVEGEPDAYAITNEVIGDNGGTVSWTLIDESPKIVGFGTRGSNNITYGIRNNPNYTLTIIHEGSPLDLSSLPTLPVWSTNDSFQVELGFVNQNKVVRYKRNGALIIAVTGVNWQKLPAKGVILGRETSLNITSVSGIFLPTGRFGVETISSNSETATLIVYEDEKDSIENWSRFTPAEIYEANNEGINNRFRVISKRDSDRTITIKPPVPIAEDDDIFAVWEAFYQTSKKVNTIIINFEGVFFSRRKPVEGETEKKGGKK